MVGLEAPADRQSGSTLIEVLVAMLVIAVGLIGVAGMLSYTVKGNQSAYVRSQATMLANDLTDAMRASPKDVAAGEFDDGCADNTNISCAYRHTWDSQVKSRLGGAASTAVARVGREVTIRIQWDDGHGAVLNGAGQDASGANSSSQIFELTTEI